MQHAAPETLANDLPFDDAALDKLKGSYALLCVEKGDGALTWCGRCTTVSHCGDWAGGDRCPHCREPLYARFLWDELRRIKPALPPTPPVGEVVAVYDF